MFEPDQTPYHQDLPGGLRLRSAASLEDVQRVADFNGLIHGPDAVGLTFNLFTAHPDTSGKDLASIQTGDGEVVASLCLIPWTLRYGKVNLPAGELGIVGTHPNYRQRGLNRRLMGYFWQRFNQRGCLLSIIQGIPYFYRQFGYEYSYLPLEGGWRIQSDQIPNEPADGNTFTFHPATPDDLPTLTRLYEAQCQQRDLSAARSREIWQYLLSDRPGPDSMQHQTLVVCAPSGEVQGYLRLPEYHFHENLLAIDEVSELSFAAGMAVLGELKRLTIERRLDGLRLNLPQNCGLLQLARACGATSLGNYPWQVAVPDMAALLRRLAPVLEQRLAGSLFAGLTRTVCLDLYRQGLALTFVDGRLSEVRRATAEDSCILRLPPLQLVPLVLGGRSIDEIEMAFPDADCRQPWKLLVQTLFPATQAFFYPIY